MKTVANQENDQISGILMTDETSRGFSFDLDLSHGNFTKKENRVLTNAVNRASDNEGKLEIIYPKKELNAIAHLAEELTLNRGEASQSSMDTFLTAGFTHASLAELMSKVAIKNATDAIFENVDFEGAFPLAAA